MKIGQREMNLTKVNLQSLTNDQLNWLAAEAMGFAGLGYYGPTKSKGGHLDQERFNTQAEALENYKKYWKGEHGCVCGADMDEDDVDLCYWKDGWGTLTANRPATDEHFYHTHDTTFEKWFFENHAQFTLSMWISKGEISVEIGHDTHDKCDAYFHDGPESRLRTLAVLQTLAKLKQNDD